MSSFTGDLVITQLSDWRWWRLEQPLRYEIGSLGSGNIIEVPKGFITDGATVPQFFWSILPTWGSYSRAAAVHDYIIGEIEVGCPLPNVPTREVADKIFWEATGVCGTILPIRVLLYIGVRIKSLLTFLGDTV